MVWAMSFAQTVRNLQQWPRAASGKMGPVSLWSELWPEERSQEPRRLRRSLIRCQTREPRARGCSSRSVLLQAQVPPARQERGSMRGRSIGSRGASESEAVPFCTMWRSAHA